MNESGRLVSKSYGRVSAINIDPVEKKPLYHFYPGEKTLSFGSFGCNLSCGFCQNSSISAVKPKESPFFTPEDSAYFAVEKNVKLISYTYNEPLTNYEWVLEMSAAARKKSMQNILVTNGYINEEPLKKLADYLDAANVDLKAFTDKFYNKVCGGYVDPVLNTIKNLHKAGVHLEITNLLIDNENTSEDDFDKMTDFIASVSDEIPLHLSRYFPDFNFTAEKTKAETLLKFYNEAKKKLKYVYIGNFDGPEEYGSTFCKSCGFCLIERNGYNIKINCKNPRICRECGVKNNIII